MDPDEILSDSDFVNREESASTSSESSLEAYDLDEDKSKRQSYIYELLDEFYEKDVRKHKAAMYKLRDCYNENAIGCYEASSRLILILLDKNDIAGMDDFWEVWDELLVQLLLINTKECMEASYKYVMDKQAYNYKEIHILKCIDEACIKLSDNSFGENLLDYIDHQEKKNGLLLMNSFYDRPSPINTKRPLIQPISSGSSSTVILKDSKTKYKPSYYRKQNEKKTVYYKNYFTTKALLFLEPLINWCLLNPPAREMTLSLVIHTISHLLSLRVLQTDYLKISQDLFSLLYLYRYHSENEVRKNCILLFSTLLERSYLKAEEMLLLAEDVNAWLPSVIEDDVDPVCRDTALRTLAIWKESMNQL